MACRGCAPNDGCNCSVVGSTDAVITVTGAGTPITSPYTPTFNGSTWLNLQTIDDTTPLDLTPRFVVRRSDGSLRLVPHRAATTLLTGVVRLATTAETQTGTSAVLAVTPAGLAAAATPAASDTVAGKVELATTAEAQAGAATTLAVTPAGLAAAVPAATDLVAGKVELATNAETITGTATTLAVTPAGVAAAVPAASDTVVGKVELATSAETLTGTDTVRAVTPAGAAATYVKLTQTINAQVGAYTFVLADSRKLVTVTNGAASIVTVPTNASVAFPIGTSIDVARLGAGAVTFAAAAGVTINSISGFLNISAQYGKVELVKIATDTWLLTGSLA